MKVEGKQVQIVEVDIEPLAAIWAMKKQFFQDIGIPSFASAVELEDGHWTFETASRDRANFTRHPGPEAKDGEEDVLKALETLYAWFIKKQNREHREAQQGEGGE